MKGYAVCYGCLPCRLKGLRRKDCLDSLRNGQNVTTEKDLSLGSDRKKGEVCLLQWQARRVHSDVDVAARHRLPLQMILASETAATML